MGSMRGRDLDPVSGPLLERSDERLENVILAPRQLGNEFAVAGDRTHRNGFRREDADDPSVRRLVRPEHRERIGTASSHDRVEVLVPRSPILPHDRLLGLRSAYRREGRAPDFGRVFANGAIGGEPTDIGDIAHRGGAPIRRIAPAPVDQTLGGHVSFKIRGHHEPVMVVKAADQLGIAARVVRREDARRDGRERLRQFAGIFYDRTGLMTFARFRQPHPRSIRK